ncbi:MAG: D-alanyl-D-alanine carboxypeptidase family protein [Candidatus Dormibacteria bacterium]
MATLIGAIALLGTTGTVAALRIRAVPPAPTPVLAVPETLLAAPGTPPPVILPPRGAIELDSDADGRIAARDADTPRPIASVAKTITALVVLEAHPLAPRDEGPTLTMTQSDVDLYRNDLAADGSTLAVAVGERLTERQLLLGLMLPSANNIADTLARWVSGSPAAFRDRMNARAASLGMGRSHFEDASGFSPLTVSTPADLVRLARAALSEPALAAIVAAPTATLPDGTVLRSLDELLISEPGWLGIKTGSTPQAGGCLLFAARRPVGGAAVPITLVGAVLGQTDRSAAQQAAKHAVDSAFAGYVPVDLGTLPLTIGGEVSSVWGANSPVEAAATPGRPIQLRQGTSLTLAVSTARVDAPLQPGTQVAAAIMSLHGHVLLKRPLLTTRALPGPGIGWRLLHV